MIYVIIGVFVALCAITEGAYLFIRHGCFKEIDRQTEERIAKAYRDDLDFDFGITVDKVRFGDEA